MKTPKTYSYEQITNVRVIDGDTIEFTIDLGFGLAFKDIFRLKGLDVAEISTTRGKEARAWLRSLFDFMTSCVLYTYKVKPYKTKKGKYGRYLFDMYVEAPHPYTHGMLSDLLKPFEKRKK